jgi:hypothetical protein
MNEAHASTTALPESRHATRTSGWSARRLAALAIGSLLILLALVLLGAGATGVWADRTQRDAGYVTTGVHDFSTRGAAIVTEPTELGSAGVGWLYAPVLLGRLRIRATPTGAAKALFVGIGPAADVDRYLGRAQRTVVTDFWTDEVEQVAGSTTVAAPAKQAFWVASDTGRGARTVVWKPRNGSWTVVVMSADGRPGLDVGTELGARLPAVLWIALGVLAAGAFFLAGGALLIAGALRGRRRGGAGETAPA